MAESDPSLSTVRAVLAKAAESGTRVAVVLRGDPAAGRPARMLEGTPVAFAMTPDGRERVVLEVVRGSTEQFVLVDRIVRVLPLAS